MPVLLPRNRVAVLALAIVLGGCMSGAPTTSPPPSVDLSTSCSGTVAGAVATQYAGWPPAAESELIPITVASELSVGRNRFLLNLLDDRNEPLSAPDREVRLRFFDLASDPATPAVETEATYLPMTEELPGLYRADVEFSCWGEWGVEAVTTDNDGSERAGRMVFPVRPTSNTPAIGAPAPASATPTADSMAEIATISTDTDPDPDFYTTSIDEALAAGQPFLVIFSTPAFCRTRTCGPALDIVKSVAPEFRDEVSFIHVEPYELETVDGQLQPVLSEQNQPIPVDAVTQWRLPTEPYIFVVDGDGRVTAKLEGVAGEDEIRAALSDVTDSG